MLFVPLRQLGKLQQEIMNPISVASVRLSEHLYQRWGFVGCLQIYLYFLTDYSD